MKKRQEFLKIYLYIVRETRSSDSVTCKVPYKINPNLIFFGPCMINLRADFYKEYLKNSISGIEEVNEEIYFIGMSGSKVPKAKKNEIRKIVWMGKLLKVLTFEQMYNYIENLADENLKKDILLMKQEKCSPIHIKPIYDERGKFKGYQVRSDLHINWIRDVMSNNNDSNVEIKEKILTLKENVDRKEVLDRDCCFLFSNIFFANGNGIDIDNEILSILRKAQPNEKDEISKYYTFGKNKNGSAKGRRGRGLLIKGNIAYDFIKILNEKISNLNINPIKKENFMSSKSKCN